MPLGKIERAARERSADPGVRSRNPATILEFESGPVLIVTTSRRLRLPSP